MDGPSPPPKHHFRHVKYALFGPEAVGKGWYRHVETSPPSDLLPWDAMDGLLSVPPLTYNFQSVAY